GRPGSRRLGSCGPRIRRAVRARGWWDRAERRHAGYVRAGGGAGCVVPPPGWRRRGVRLRLAAAADVLPGRSGRPFRCRLCGPCRVRAGRRARLRGRLWGRLRDGRDRLLALPECRLGPVLSVVGAPVFSVVGGRVSGPGGCALVDRCDPVAPRCTRWGPPTLGRRRTPLPRTGGVTGLSGLRGLGVAGGPGGPHRLRFGVRLLRWQPRELDVLVGPAPPPALRGRRGRPGRLRRWGGLLGGFGLCRPA